MSEENKNNGEEKNEIYEVKSNLTFGDGFTFGLGFGVSFFISGIIISFFTGVILFIIFGAAISSFQKAVTDPFGLKGSSYSQPAPASSQFSFPSLFK